MRFVLLIIFCAGPFAYYPGVAQDFSLFSETVVQGSSFNTDPLGNFYIIDNQRIVRYSADGVKTAEYSNAYLGQIAYADVSDPLNILIFYEDFNQIQFLDNKLAEIGKPVSLDAVGNEQTSLACSSTNTGFWVYNPQIKQLILFNKMLDAVYKGTILNAVVSGEISPICLLERNNSLYMTDPEKGILVFDKYGVYLETLDIFGVKFFQVLQNEILFFRGNKYFRYDCGSRNMSEIVIPANENVLDVRMEKDRLYVFTGIKIQVFTIK